ncbi:MAG: RNA polymerase sigma factor [Kineosporiaceae bacterium]
MAVDGPLSTATVERDSELVGRLRCGDEQAFAALVDAWSPAMLRLARTFVGTRQAAEDVVQDAWLGVVTGLARFEGRSSLRTWTFTILVNRARTRGAKEARTVAVSQLRRPDDSAASCSVDPDRFQGPDGEYPSHWTSLGAPTAWEHDPERGALAGEVRAVLEAALAALPPRQAAAVTLRDVVGVDSDEACVALGVSPENQRVLLHRGRAALRAALEDYYRA